MPGAPHRLSAPEGAGLRRQGLDKNGWREYFKRGYPARVFGKLNYHSSERVIRHLRRRSQRPYRFEATESYHAQLKELGLQRL